MKYVGVDIGGMSIKCGIVSEDGIILSSKSVVTPLTGARDIAKATADTVKELLSENNMSLADTPGIGVGVPGIVDLTTQEVKYSCNLLNRLLVKRL